MEKPGDKKPAGRDWESWIDQQIREAQAINKEIAVLNLKVPSSRFQRLTIDAARAVADLEE